MASKKVNLKISLKDNVSSGLKKIGGGLKTLGSGFKKLGIAGVAATTAIIGGLVAVTKAYAEQESVNNKLKATFDAAGESGAKAVAQWGAWATEIQRTTTLGDEEIMSLVTLGKTMGVTNDKLAEATKGAIGLSKAFGIDMTSSMKMVALAQQGEFEMLQRYIPELRKATTEAEKQEIVTRAMANGFKVAEAELDTVAGAFKALKGVVGDAMQEAGKAVAGNGSITSGLEKLKEIIIELTEDGTIARWAEDASTAFNAVKKVIEPVINFIGTLIKHLNRLGRFLGAFSADISAGLSFKDAVKGAQDYVDSFDDVIEAQKKSKAEQAEWDKMLAEQRDYDQKFFSDDAPVSAKAKVSAPSTGLESVSEKIKEATSTTATSTKAPAINESTASLFKELSKGRSFEGATKALGAVSTATEGETIKLVASLLEQQNKILAENLGGVSGG